MLYVIGIIVLLLIVFIVIKIINSRNKAFSSKLTLRERKELEKMLEKKNKIDEVEENDVIPETKKVENEVKEKVIEKKEVIPAEEPAAKIKTIFPSKDIKEEISRFETYTAVNNFKVQNSIRNGVQNFANLDYKVALEEFSLAIELNPQDPTGYFCRGLTKLQLKNFESALSDFSDSINLRYKEPGAFYYRALTYYKLKDIDNAILNFKSYLSAESGFAQAHYDLAICYKEKERLEEAISSFSKALEIDPGFELAYFERGLLKHKANDKDGGCVDLKKALSMGYLKAYDSVRDLCGDRKL